MIFWNKKRKSTQ